MVIGDSTLTKSWSGWWYGDDIETDCYKIIEKFSVLLQKCKELRLSTCRSG